MLSSSRHSRLTWAARVVYITLIVLAVMYQSVLQRVIHSVYAFLLTTWVFNSVYFETWWTTIVYALVKLVYLIIDKITYFNSYKLDPKVKHHYAGLMNDTIEAIQYVTPLMILDTFITKRYTGCGIDAAEWQTRRVNWIQTTRALPEQAPTLLQITVHIVLSFVVYDAIFFILHYMAHKNAWLYRHLHAVHHKHGVLHSQITNQLSVAERVVLVLSANQALKFFSSHPLTRVIFVPVFVAGLMENHCGYDFPWTLNRIIPGDIVGGSPCHYLHHMYGERHYQPFFTYLDKLILARSNKLKKPCLDE